MSRRFRNRVRYAPGVMNKLEGDYASALELQKRAGLILDWRFEPMKLKLAQNCTYSPDFLVIEGESEVEFAFHEVKGHWRDDARVKIRVAATTFPYFKFLAVTRSKAGMWEFEEFKA